MNRSISQTYGLRLPGKIYSGAHSIEKLREIIDGKYKKIAVFTDAGVMAAGVLNRTLAILKETGVQFLLLDNRHRNLRGSRDRILWQGALTMERS